MKTLIGLADSTKTPKYLTTREIANTTVLELANVRRLCKLGMLPCLRDGKKYLIEFKGFESFMVSRKEKSKARAKKRLSVRLKSKRLLNRKVKENNLVAV